MTDDYKKKVILAYQKKKEEGTLSSNLMNPSPGKLRDECFIVYHERYHPKDDEILRLFFISKNNDYSQSIRNFRIDDLRPLVNLLSEKKKIGRPHDKNIKLLSWLIDFEPRPYVFGQIYEERVDLEVKVENTDQITETKTKKREIVQPITIAITAESKPLVKTIDRHKWKKITIGAAFLIILGALSIYFYPTILSRNENITTYPNKTSSREKSPYVRSASKEGETPEKKSVRIDASQCMYWAEDHYEPIACNETKSDVVIIAMNKKKMARLRKITNLDTMGVKDIGRTWYFKIARNSVEFYTDSGTYPLDNKRILKPMTSYMLNKYILSTR